MKPLSILLVEDNDGDVVLTKETFSELKLSNTVNVVRDGEEALRYLNALATDSANVPGLILLDINLPKVDGKELLAYIKDIVPLNTIPVIVLTTSSSQKDMEECRTPQVLDYIIKPLDAGKFVAALFNSSRLYLTLHSN
jgi:two-component system, chemotaxis family, response regulator Rcp1